MKNKHISSTMARNHSSVPFVVTSFHKRQPWLRFSTSNKTGDCWILELREKQQFKCSNCGYNCTQNKV